MHGGVKVIMFYDVPNYQHITPVNGKDIYVDAITDSRYEAENYIKDRNGCFLSKDYARGLFLVICSVKGNVVKFETTIGE